MITKISHISLYVDDQEKAKQFYVEKLGFQVHTDVMFGQDRWLTLCLPHDRDCELVVFNATEPSARAMIGKQAALKVPFLVLTTNDCLGDFERLKAAGVEIVEEPKTESWGTSGFFLDLVGNLISIVEPS